MGDRLISNASKWKVRKAENNYHIDTLRVRKYIKYPLLLGIPHASAHHYKPKAILAILVCKLLAFKVFWYIYKILLALLKIVCIM